MPAPSSEKGRQRREQILDAAAALLVESGYAGFSSRGIAERLGMRLSNVQYYFATPADILSALFARELERARAAFDARPGADLQALVGMLLDAQHDDANCRVFWELWALAARDRAIADIMERFYQRYRDAVAALIAEALPGIAEATRRRRATLIVAMIEGLSLFRSGRDRALRREAIAAAAALARGAPPAEG